MRTYMMKTLPACLLLLGTAPAWAAAFNVTVGGSAGSEYPVLMFSPRNLTINVGDTVTFRNAGGFHNVHADNESFRCAQGCDGDGAGGNGNPVDGNWSSTVTFTHAGSIPYHCDNHAGSGMTGTITVQGAAGGNVPITNGFTGSWVNPEGKLGLGLEVLAGGNMVAEGYTFAAAGGQLWIGGVGPITGDHAAITVTTITGAGGRFPPNFDASQTQNTTWGTLTFTFTDCNNGAVAWASAIPGYGSGSMPIIRLTQPAGVACP